MSLEQYVMNISGRALYYIVILSAPMLVSALLVGLFISIIQATTQVQEQTLSFVPKIIATFAAILIAGPWISRTIASFAIELLSNIPNLVHFKN